MALQIEVELAERRYPIIIGKGLLQDPTVWASCISDNEVVIITNAVVAEHYLARCQTALANYRCHTIILPDGEAYKNWQTLSTIFDGLMVQRFSRKVTLVALGGGVIGDMTGFAAACYQRGVPFVQVPTTLLAQVDSSVGGKTGINHALGKNMIGAFYQPKAVLIDTATLNTLPAREYAAGLTEVLKYGLIADADFFAWLEQNVQHILAKKPAVLTELIARCCSIKADVVAQDEYETTGVRAILNFGHTFGHAIETVMGYGNVLHGEAVAMGMLLALKYQAWGGRLGGPPEPRAAIASTRRGCSLTGPDALVLMERTFAWLKAVGLPTQLPTKDVDALLAAMQQDKKKLASQLRLILLEQVGKAMIVPAELSDLKAFLQQEVAHVKK